jgi:hypothetical protein
MQPRYAAILSIGAVALGFSASAAWATGDVNRTSCPPATEASPGFRAALPDCRAYELVTPPLKNGQPPVTGGSSISSAAGIAFTSLGSFNEPGNSATPEGGEYVANRGGTSWSTVAVNPSAEQFQGGSALLGGVGRESIDFAGSLAESLILQPLRADKPVDLRFYRRSVENGAIREVGPLVPPAAVTAWTPQDAEDHDVPLPIYTGASADLSHIFFSDTFETTGPLQWLWPGDQTVGEVHPSLYEYAGSENREPELVGVRNQTSLASAAFRENKAHINEAAEQISECGVLLGGVAQFSNPSSADTYNAVSRSGETVYFTPLQGPCETVREVGAGPTVAEVYARVDRSRTIDISEPSTGPTGDCEACDETEPRNAIFQGASEDGTAAFFISEQMLFGGSRGESGTNLYEYAQSQPAHQKLTFIAPLLSESGGTPGGVVRVSESGQYVYFVSSDSNLAKMPLSSTGHAAQDGGPNLYVFDTGSGESTFVATLATQDQSEWSAEDFRRVEATSDGRFLLFPSVGQLTPDAGGVGRQLYRFEAPTDTSPDGELVRVSVGAAGEYMCAQTHEVESRFNCDGNATPPPSSRFASRYARTSQPEYASLSPARASGVAITSDGTKVYFESPEGLTPGALNEVCAQEVEESCRVAASNVYEWEDGEVYLLSDGSDSNPLFGTSATKLIGADTTGENVFLTTSRVLVPQDTDSQVDIYDARSNGGFPSLSTSVPCQSACRAESTAPTFAAPASSSLNSPTDDSGPPAPRITKPTPMPRPNRAEKLARALRACRAHSRRRRTKCKAAARRRYGPVKSAAGRQTTARRSHF